MNLSIIIPIFNVEQYLHQCLDSVLCQIKPNFEVICINDSSTDESRYILEDFHKRYPELIIIDRENGGLSAARNSGLEVAKGEYVYFLDSDDFLLPEVLSNMIKFSQDNNLDIACFNAMKDDGVLYFNPKIVFEEIKSGQAFFDEFSNENKFFPVSPVWMYLYKLNFLRQCSLKFKEGVVHEDEQFTPRAFFYAQRVKMLNIPIINHRVKRIGAITSSFKIEHIIDRINNCTDVFDFLYLNKCKSPKFFHYISNIYETAAKALTENQSETHFNVFSKRDYKLWRANLPARDHYIYYFLFRYFNTSYKRYINFEYSSGVSWVLKIVCRLLFYISVSSK